ncbi:uncharacterized protein [Dendropsophus ebraccatus]|uniref:uncharacterized protein isoform X3 n=1 Tax=Dendropsophus ebraccatus TaxID=150705 RepID=UPI003831DB6A
MGPRAQLLLLLGLLSCCCRGEEQVKLLSGSDAVFRADVSDRPSEITWLIGRDKIVDLEQGRLPDFYRMKERVVADLEKGTLILKVVTPADSGQYRANRLVEGKIFTNDFRLLVFDHVCPVVIRNSTTGNNVTLQCKCSDRGAQPSKYEWYNHTSRLSGEESLMVQKGESAQLYRCVASNDLSKSEANVTVPAQTTASGKRSYGLYGLIILPIIIVFIGLGVLHRKGRHQDGGKQSGNQEPGAGHQDGGKQSGNQGPGAGHQDGGKQSGNQGPGADPDLLALEETSSLL